MVLPARVLVVLVIMALLQNSKLGLISVVDYFLWCDVVAQCCEPWHMCYDTIGTFVDPMSYHMGMTYCTADRG